MAQYFYGDYVVGRREDGYRDSSFCIFKAVLASCKRFGKCLAVTSDAECVVDIIDGIDLVRFSREEHIIPPIKANTFEYKQIHYIQTVSYILFQEYDDSNCYIRRYAPI